MTQIYSIGIAGGHYLDIILKKLLVCVWKNSRFLALVPWKGTELAGLGAKQALIV